MVLTILLDENIEGYADYLSRFVFSPVWSDISIAIGVCLVTFDNVGLAKGATDEQIWEFCQEHQFFLLTDNRNQDKPDSLETMIRTRTLSNSLPVFTISDLQRFRLDPGYIESLVEKLLEYLMDADKLGGVGRLYLP